MRSRTSRTIDDDEADADDIETATETLSEELQEIGKQIYQEAGAADAGAAGGAGCRSGRRWRCCGRRPRRDGRRSEPGPDAGAAGDEDEEFVDADFEDVDFDEDEAEDDE